jgi:uncharacterized protein YuzE
MKIHQNRNEIVIRHAGEDITIDVDKEQKIVHIWATDQSGGYTIATVKFLSDRTQLVKL